MIQMSDVIIPILPIVMKKMKSKKVKSVVKFSEVQGMCDDSPDIHGATESNGTTKSSASMLLEVKKAFEGYECFRIKSKGLLTLILFRENKRLI